MPLYEVLGFFFGFEVGNLPPARQGRGRLATAKSVIIIYSYYNTFTPKRNTQANASRKAFTRSTTANATQKRRGLGLP